MLAQQPDDRPLEGMPKEELVARVKEIDRRMWHAFCEGYLGKHDPAHYPRRCLIAFLSNQLPPTLQELMDNVEEFDKRELVLCCNAAVEQGASPLEFRGNDPSGYSEVELTEYLQNSCTGYDDDGRRTRWPCLHDRSKISNLAHAQLVGLVKQCNYRPWHDFCNETLAKYSPSAYPRHYLVAFLAGDGPLGVEGSADELSSLSKEELVSLCRAAMKDGAQPPVGRGKDPMRYTQGELLQYLQVHRSSKLDTPGAPPADEEGDDSLEVGSTAEMHGAEGAGEVGEDIYAQEVTEDVEAGNQEEVVDGYAIEATFQGDDALLAATVDDNLEDDNNGRLDERALPGSFLALLTEHR